MSSFDLVNMATIGFGVFIVLKLLFALKDGKISRSEYKGLMKTAGILVVIFLLFFSFRGYNSYQQLNVLEKPFKIQLANGVTANIQFASLSRVGACELINKGTKFSQKIFPDVDAIKQKCVLSYYCDHAELPFSGSQIGSCLKSQNYLLSAVIGLFNSGFMWLFGALVVSEILLDSFSLFVD